MPPRPAPDAESRPRPSGARWRARRTLCRVMAWTLRRRSRTYRAEPGSVTLIIAPHPDDETLGCAGLMLLRARARQPVHIAYLTDGSGSHPGHPLVPPALLAERRRAEAVAATAALGVPAARLHFLDARDGTLDHLEPAAAAALQAGLVRTLALVRPTELVLPCRQDGSSEHEAGFGLVLASARAAGLRCRLLEYPVWAWWNPRRLLRPWLHSRRVWRAAVPGQAERKRAALARYTTQFEALPPWPQPVMAPEFPGLFATPEEFYFETE